MLRLQVLFSHLFREIVLTYRAQSSPKVAIIRFERGMQQGLLARISRSPIMEYHAFGIVSYVIGILGI
jgi:hypothetical protein